MKLRKSTLLLSGLVLITLAVGSFAYAQEAGSLRDTIRARVLERIQEQRGTTGLPASGATSASAKMGAINPASWPAPTVDASPFDPNDVQVGDPKGNYFNVETYGDYPYVVWIETQTNSSNKGVMWHCGINPDTGDLIPSDCRGFKAFESTGLNRANIGIDNKGLYYVGADADGKMKFVRPTGPTSGTVSDIAITPDTRRRAYYPSLLPQSSKQYVAWILNENVAARGTDNRNAWVELQYIDIADPTKIHTIERQDRPNNQFAPMDSAFFRWFQDKAALTFGSYSDNGIDIKVFDVASGKSTFVTDSTHRKADPYPWIFGNLEVVMPGIDVGPFAYIYTRPKGTTGMLTASETIITPAQSELETPVLAQSFQPIVWDGKAYAAYQINDMGTGSITTFFQIFSKPGEIWFTTILQDTQKQWRISASNNLVKAEPETFIGNKTAWVFYSAAPAGSDMLTTNWQLRRASVPLGEYESGGSSSFEASSDTSSARGFSGFGFGNDAERRVQPVRSFIAFISSPVLPIIHFFGEMFSFARN